MNTKILTALTIIILAFVCFAGCEREPDSPPLGQIDESKILTIGDIYKIQADSGDFYTFNEDFMLYATVIMADESGNIYREAYLQDSTGGINITRLNYTGVTEQGNYVRINLKEAILSDDRGKMKLNFEEVDNFRRRIVTIRTNVPVTPAEASLTDILTGRFESQLVTLKNVQFVDTTVNYAVFGGTSIQNRDLQNCQNQRIIVRTSDRADFAGEKVASGNGDLTGVITKYIYPTTGDIAWQLFIRNLSDVNMEGERCEGTKHINN